MDVRRWDYIQLLLFFPNSLCNSALNIPKYPRFQPRPWIFLKYPHIYTFPTQACQARGKDVGDDDNHRESKWSEGCGGAAERTRWYFRFWISCIFFTHISYLYIFQVSTGRTATIGSGGGADLGREGGGPGVRVGTGIGGKIIWYFLFKRCRGYWWRSWGYFLTLQEAE